MTDILLAANYETPLGWIAHDWTRHGLYSVRILDIAAGKCLPKRMLGNPECIAQAEQFEASIDQYFAGNFAALNEARIDVSGWSPFFAKVYQECRSVGAGETISYGELASRAGRAAAARAVGQAMARNRIPLVIPCHRIVGSTGKLTGFSAPGGVDTKRLLLELESQTLLVGR